MRKKINGDLVNAIQKAIENCGSQSELARLIGKLLFAIKKDNVNLWHSAKLV